MKIQSTTLRIGMAVWMFAAGFISNELFTYVCMPNQTQAHAIGLSEQPGNEKKIKIDDMKGIEKWFSDLYENYQREQLLWDLKWKM